ncbi:hypothetical protein K7432_017354 [Basidiobolus ranarum]|uniref:thioredoxin-dependent peroxiredoxin n=1 Tax=Basidiobolus ranarum TaxID=34480 RepID=A0ABR2VKQ5_9FUNG
MIPVKRVTRSASAAAAIAGTTASSIESAPKKAKTETKKPVETKAVKNNKTTSTKTKSDTQTRKTRTAKAEPKVEKSSVDKGSAESPTPDSPVIAKTPESQPNKTRAARSTSGAKKTEEPSEPGKPEIIAEGSYLPDDLDSVLTDAGEEVKLQELVKSNGLVIFFYPRANTPGCTMQACGFRDRLPEATSEGYKVYGMSADSPKAQTTWKNKHKLGYTLLCDPEYKVLKRLGVMKQPKGIKRSHIVIEKGGKIKSLKIQIGPKPSVEQALATVTESSE